MARSPNRLLIAYLVAIVSIGVATAIRFWLDPVLGDHLTFAVYYLAVAIAARAGGVWPAVITAVVSSLLANYFFSAPQYSLRIDSPTEFLAQIMFLSVSVVIGLLSEGSLRALARARRAEQQKDDFLAILAHELRTPLAVIYYTNQVGHRSGVKSGQDRSDVIDRQVHQLNQMIDDLLDISRVTRGKFRMQFERVDAMTEVDGALQKVQHLIESREHELTVQRCQEALPVWADPLRLEQVLTNLLTNAAKYTPKRGRIDLQVTRENDNAVFRVRDNGQGIPKEMVSRVFDLVTQVERSLEDPERGLGIGLALVRTLTELHGGTVSVTSEGPGRGSEFIVRLPLVEDEPALVQSAPT
jgi:signal transduction histidine kinase